MYTKKVVALAAMAAFAEQVIASDSHRHMHQQAKKAIENEVFTVWKTVYVTAGQEPVPTNSPAEQVVEPVHDAANQFPQRPATSTVVSVVQPPAPTTLSSVVKPNPAPSAVEEVEESIAPVLNPVEPTATSEEPKPTGDNSNNGSVRTLTKRGMAFNSGDLANTFGGASGGKIGWAYNWGSSRQGLDSLYEFMPTLWSDDQDHTGHWDSDVEQCLASGSQVLFSFNEPDNVGQANMSPEAAAAAHNQWLGKYAGRAQICAPSVTNSGSDGEGLSWLQRFHDACDAIGGCQIDCCNIHWYSDAQWSETLFEHISKAKDICGQKPVYLTEFAPTDGDIDGFMKDVIPRLDTDEGPAAYSYFWVTEGSLMNSATDLSSFGQIYATI